MVRVFSLSTTVSIYGDVVTIRASTLQRRIRHPYSAACEILNLIQVHFATLELHYHKPHFHYKSPRSSKFIIQHQQQWLSVIHATKEFPRSFIFQEWTTFVCNTNRTLTQISRFEIPFF